MLLFLPKKFLLTSGACLSSSILLMSAIPSLYAKTASEACPLFCTVSYASTRISCCPYERFTNNNRMCIFCSFFFYFFFFFLNFFFIYYYIFYFFFFFFFLKLIFFF